MTDLSEYGEKLSGALPGAIRAYHVSVGELTLEAELGEIVRVMKFLRDDPSCEFKISRRHLWRGLATARKAF